MKIKLLFVGFLIVGFNAKFRGQAGTLDNTFGTGGIVTTTIGSGSEYGQAIVIQTDGKIIVVGNSGNNLGLARYNTNGTLDNTFGTGGIVSSNLGCASAMPGSVVLQNDGKIVVGGYCGIFPNYDFVTVRYNANGSLDNTFGTGGIEITPVLAAGDQGRAIAIQSDGKIILGGNTDNGSNSDMAVVRYNANGTLDNTFGTGGIVTTSVGTANDIIRTIAIQPDGKILVSGYCYISASFSYDFGVVRHNSDGSLDNTFGTGGKVTTGIIASTNDYAEKIIIQSDGKIIVAGYSFTGFLVMARYNSNGTLDNTFGTGGSLSTAFGCAYQNNYSAAQQSDGKILVTGFSTLTSTPSDFALIRYNNNGSIDNTFGTSGITNSAIGTSTDVATSIAIQTDGNIVVAGSSYNGTNFDFALARYSNTVVSSGINNISRSITDLKIHPNPSTGSFYVKCIEELTEVKIYNIIGEEIFSISCSGTEVLIETEDMSAGIYFVRVKCGENLITKKLILE